MTSVRSTSTEQTLHTGELIGSALTGGEVIALYAPLGAGKTVIAKGIARCLDITEVVTSPTYTIISEYTGRLRLVHVDLYRVNSEEEFEQLALDEYMGTDAVAIIEWPERAGAALPLGALRVEIAVDPSGDRIIQVPDSLAASLPTGTKHEHSGH